MQTALEKAIALILSKDAELLNILGITAQMRSDPAQFPGENRFHRGG